MRMAQLSSVVAQEVPDVAVTESCPARELAWKWGGRRNGELATPASAAGL